MTEDPFYTDDELEEMNEEATGEEVDEPDFEEFHDKEEVEDEDNPWL